MLAPMNLPADGDPFPFDDVPGSAGALPARYHKPDGKPLVGMYLPNPDAANDPHQIPEEYMAVHARELHPEDLMALGKAGYRLASDDDLEGQGAVRTVKVVPFRHSDGLGILKRYGQKRYQLWLDTKEREAALAADLKIRNAAIAAQEARPARVAKPINDSPIVTIQEPGQPPETFVLTPRVGFWQRVRTFFARLFRRNA